MPCGGGCHYSSGILKAGGETIWVAVVRLGGETIWVVVIWLRVTTNGLVSMQVASKAEGDTI